MTSRSHIFRHQQLCLRHLEMEELHKGFLQIRQTDENCLNFGRSCFRNSSPKCHVCESQIANPGLIHVFRDTLTACYSTYLWMQPVRAKPKIWNNLQVRLATASLSLKLKCKQLHFSCKVPLSLYIFTIWLQYSMLRLLFIRVLCILTCNISPDHSFQLPGVVESVGKMTGSASDSWNISLIDCNSYL